MTIIGVKQPDFVVLAADGKTTCKEKVVNLEKRKVLGVAGCYVMTDGLSTDCTAAEENFFSQSLKYPTDPLRAIKAFNGSHPHGDWSMIVGGFEAREEFNWRRSPFLASVLPYSESIRDENFYVLGSGKVYASNIMNEMPSDPYLSVQDAQKWVERALVSSALFDKAAGGNYIIRITERTREFEIEGGLILEDLWIKHQDYFEKEHNCKFGELPQHIKDDWIKGETLNNKGWEEQWREWKEKNESQ